MSAAYGTIPIRRPLRVRPALLEDEVVELRTANAKRIANVWDARRVFLTTPFFTDDCAVIDLRESDHEWIRP